MVNRARPTEARIQWMVHTAPGGFCPNYADLLAVESIASESIFMVNGRADLASLGGYRENKSMRRVRKADLRARFVARVNDCAERAASAETEEAKRMWIAAAAAWRDMAVSVIDEKSTPRDREAFNHGKYSGVDAVLPGKREFYNWDWVSIVRRACAIILLRLSSSYSDTPRSSRP